METSMPGPHTHQLDLVASEAGGGRTPSPTLPLGTAAQLAELLQVDRCWVYEHKQLVGARYLGDGPRARLRFSPLEAMAALSRSRDEAPVARRGARRRPGAGAPGVTKAGNSLLPLPG